MKIKYLKHPVDEAEKRKLNAEGYRVIDIKYAPEGYEQEESKPTKKRSKKSDSE